MAVECDGERWHSREKLEQDMQRQAVLERLGWRFVRIRGSVFYRDPERAMRPVFDALERLKIEPSLSVEADKQAMGSDLINEVKRRAQQLRQQWETEMAERGGVSLIPAVETKPQARPASTVAPIAATIIREAPINIRRQSEGAFGIQVGDSVEFVYLDRPEAVEFVMLTTEPSNKSLGTINENSLLASALLGRLENEQVTYKDANGGRVLKIAKIHKLRRRA